LNPDFIALLRKHDVALVFADTAGKFPYMEDLTSDFVYARLHGADELYRSGYSPATLRWWSERFKTWRGGREPADAQTVSGQKPEAGPRDLFVYFDNTDKMHAPANAQEFARMLLDSGEKRRQAEHRRESLDPKNAPVHRRRAENARHDHAR
jgi:uncharacterized protein YecE (DUF72 family)